MLKDQAYHEAAIAYNEGLAEAAETLAPTLGHEEPQRWCTAVGKQHRFHAKRHRSALNKILAGQTPEVVERIPDGLDVPEPADEVGVPQPAELEVNFRDAGTGQFVSQQYAEEHPGTTVSETETAVETVRTYDDGCSPHHVPTAANCEFNPNNGGVANG